MPNIAIIGAGASGLSAAFDLTRAGHQVTIYEAGDEVGGLAAGFRDEKWEWTLEKFYHHWFMSDEHVLQLADELGVRDQVIFPRPKTSYWINGKIYRSEISPTAILLPLPFIGKIRLALAGVYLKLARSWRNLEKVTADEWLQRWMGKSVYETLWKPLLIGKFGEFYQEVNMAWMWARIHSRTLKLGTFEGGFQAFLEVLANRVKSDGATLKLATRVEHVERCDDGRLILKSTSDNDENTDYFDAVLSTTSPRLLRKLTPQIDGDYANKLDSLRSMGAVVVILALKQQLLEDGTYWLSLPSTSPDKSKSKFPFLALVEHTNYLDRTHYGGDRIVYCGDYVAPDHEYFQLSDDELAERFIATLRTFNPNFSPDWISKRWVFRAPYAQPLPTINHSENIPDIRTPVKGLYWASMSQVYPWDRGTNYAVEIGRRTANMVMEDLA
jgi:protoporphyrinogen oxidase